MGLSDNVRVGERNCGAVFSALFCVFISLVRSIVVLIRLVGSTRCRVSRVRSVVVLTRLVGRTRCVALTRLMGRRRYLGFLRVSTFV